MGQFNLVGKLSLHNLYAAGQSALLPGIIGAMMSSLIVGRVVVGKEQFGKMLDQDGMSLKRVVITGVGVVSPFGNGVPALMKGIEEGRSAVRRMEGWEQYIGLHSLVAAPVDDPG